MIEHSISLLTEKDIDKNLIRAWFHAVRDNAPGGVVMTINQNGKAIQVIRTQENGIKFTIPLSRDLTDGEVKKIIDIFSQDTKLDFRVTATSSPLDIKVSPEITMDHDPIMNLCSKWAQSKHDNWMKGKTDAGWRYGPVVSTSNKTHPLLRPWNDVPAEYRKVDAGPAQELLDLLRSSGYVIISRVDLDNLLGGQL